MGSTLTALICQLMSGDLVVMMAYPTATISSAAARARTLCADWREARARRRRRARTASSSLDSACSSFSTSSRPPKMPFHTRDTSPRCLRFCIAGVSCGMGDRGDAAAAAAAGAGASPSAIGGAKTGTGRI